jgi:hypothetical protein
MKLHYLFNLLFLLHYSVFSHSFLVSSFLPLSLLYSFLVTYILLSLIFPLLICPSSITIFTSIFYHPCFFKKAIPNPVTQLCNIDYSSTINYYYIIILRWVHGTTKSFSIVRVKIWCYHNVSVDFKHTGRKAVVHFNEAQDRDELRALLNAVMNLGCVKKEENSWLS